LWHGRRDPGSMKFTRKKPIGKHQNSGKKRKVRKQGEPGPKEKKRTPLTGLGKISGNPR